MPRNSKQTFLTAAALTLSSTAAFAGGFTPGNLVIDRVGDGSAALSNAATAVFLDEYTVTGGSTVQSLALPTIVSSGATGPYSLNGSGSATSEGQINLSPNGQYLTVTGYNTALGTVGAASALPNPATGANLRAVGIVNVSTGIIDSLTGIATSGGGYYVASATAGNNIRDAVVANDGVSVYTAGATVATTTPPQTGTAYTAADTVGNSVGVSSGTGTNITNNRTVGINSFNSSLYYATGSTAPGVYLVPGATPGTLPGSTPSTPVQIASDPNSVDPVSNKAVTASPYDFLFTNANTLYVSDDRTAADGGGLLKFTSTDGFATLANTTLAYTLTVGTLGLRSVTFDGTNFYATTTTAVTAPNSIVTFTDPGTGTGLVPVTATTVVTAGTNEYFRGVRLIPTPAVVAPEPSSLLVTLLGAGTLGLLIARRRLRRPQTLA